METWRASQEEEKCLLIFLLKILLEEQNLCKYILIHVTKVLQASNFKPGLLVSLLVFFQVCSLKYGLLQMFPVSVAQVSENSFLAELCYAWLQLRGKYFGKYTPEIPQSYNLQMEPERPIDLPD